MRQQFGHKLLSTNSPYSSPPNFALRVTISQQLTTEIATHYCLQLAHSTRPAWARRKISHHLSQELLTRNSEQKQKRAVEKKGRGWIRGAKLENRISYRISR